MSGRRRFGWAVFLGTAALVAGVPELFFEPPDEALLVVAGAQRTAEASAPAAIEPAPAAAAPEPAAEVRDLFAVRDWSPPPPPVAPAVAPVAASPPREASPAAPALPFEYLGKLQRAQRTQVFLVRGERLYAVFEGDLIEDAYRVEKIADRVMTLRYLPLDVVQQLSVGSSL